MPPITRLIDKGWEYRFLYEVQPPILTPEDFFERDSIMLAQELKCPLEDIEQCKRNVALRLLKLPNGSTMLDVASAIPSDFEKRAFRSVMVKTFGYGDIDECFGNGLPSRHMISLIGEAQSGKTHLAMMMAVNNALRGHRVLYIDTCNQLSLKRLQSLITYSIVHNLMMSNSSANTPLSANTPFTPDQRNNLTLACLEKIHIQKCYDLWSALNLFTKLADATSTTTTSSNASSTPQQYDVIVLDCLHHLLAPYLMENTERVAGTHTNTLPSSTSSSSTATSSFSLVANVHPLLAQLHLLMRKVCCDSTSNVTIFVTNVAQSVSFFSSTTLTSSGSKYRTSSTTNSARMETGVKGAKRLSVVTGTGGIHHVTEMYDTILYAPATATATATSVSSPSSSSTELQRFMQLEILLRPPYWKMLPETVQVPIPS